MNKIQTPKLVSTVRIFLNLIFYLFISLSAFIVILFIIKMINPQTEILDFSFQKEMTLAELLPNSKMDLDIPELLGVKISNIRATTSFNITQRQSIFLAFISFACAMGFIIFIIHNFNRILRNFETGNIFILENGKRIKHIGYFIVFTEAVTFILSFIFEIYQITIDFFTSTFTAAFDNSLFMFFIGLGLIILGQIFYHGFNIVEEQKLTV